MSKPQIRFKGFEDEWVYLPFNSLCNYIASNLTASNAQALGQFPLYDANKLIGFTNTHYISKPYITIIKDGAGVGRVRALPKNTYFIGTLGALVPNESSTLDFLLPLSDIQNFALHNSGSTIPHIYFSQYGETIVSVPTLLEQKNVGNFFKQIDELITESEREVSRLEKIKQASLQKMFPRPGATAPEIRFDGYTEPWVNKRLSDCASFSRGQGYTKNDLRESGTPIFLYGRLYTKYSTYVDSVDTYSFVAPNSVISKGNEVVMPSSGETAEDIAVASAILAKGIILGGGLNIIIPNNIDPILLALSLTFCHAHYELAKKAQGKSVVHIYNKDIADLTISCPTTLDEQKAIAEYFRNLDSILSAKRQKLIKLRNIKQACLDKMFVNSSKL